MSFTPHSPSSLPRTAVIIWTAALVYMACVSVVTWPYLIDDAYIGFRYIDNFVHGNGFVFNPPDRVEGVTNIGWLLVVLPFSLVIPVTIAAKVLSLYPGGAGAHPKAGPSSSRRTGRSGHSSLMAPGDRLQF